MILGGLNGSNNYTQNDSSNFGECSQIPDEENAYVCRASPIQDEFQEEMPQIVIEQAEGAENVMSNIQEVSAEHYDEEEEVNKD